MQEVFLHCNTPLAEERELEARSCTLQPQGKPGNPGDNRLAVLATEEIYSSYKP
jgi:hypothetical protein